MPMQLEPPKGTAIPTKPIRRDDWAADGPEEEHCDIVAYLRPEVDKAAREAATKTITPARGPAREEFDQRVYQQTLFASQLKGWRIMAPATDDGTIPDFQSRTFIEDGYRWWCFEPRNVTALPWAIAVWLSLEIQMCGGVLETRSLVVTTEEGVRLDFRGTPAGVGTGDVPEVLDPQRDPALSATARRVRTA